MDKKVHNIIFNRHKKVSDRCRELVGEVVENAKIVAYLGQMQRGKDARHRLIIECLYEWDGEVCGISQEMPWESIAQEDATTPLGCLSCRRRYKNHHLEYGLSNYVEPSIIGIKADAFAVGEYWDKYLLSKWSEL